MSPTAAAAEGKRPSLRNKGGGDREFEENLKPNNARVNFGVAKNEKAKKEKPKKKRSPVRIAVTLLIVLVLLGGAGTALYLTGILNPVLEPFGLARSSGGVLSAEERDAMLDDREAMLDVREKSLDQREERLNAREETLAQAEAAAQETDAGNTSFETLLGELTDEKLEEIKRVGLSYSKMDPAQAAAILSGLDSEVEASLILYHMPPAASALVLEKMDVTLAADLTRMMMG